MFFPARRSGLNRNMARIRQDALLSCASGVCLSIDLAVWSQQRVLDTCDCLVYEFRKSQRLVPESLGDTHCLQPSRTF